MYKYLAANLRLPHLRQDSGKYNTLTDDRNDPWRLCPSPPVLYMLHTTVQHTRSPTSPPPSASPSSTSAGGWKGHLNIERAHHPAPALVQHMRVEHRCRHIRMPEQFLNRANVVAAFEQMRPLKRVNTA